VKEHSKKKEQTGGGYIPRYAQDYTFAQLLISGNEKAWNVFYKEYREKLSKYIESRYPRTFTDTDVEEICDGVQRRLMANNYRALKTYKGKCSFGRYLAEATEWELKDWLRANTASLDRSSLDDPSIKVEVKSKSAQLSESEVLETDVTDETEENLAEEIPQVLYDILSDEVRWAFLLRYYDYFGFPVSEIRLLSKRRGISIRVLTGKIIQLLECREQGLLESRRRNQQEMEDRLQKLFTDVSRLQHEQKRILNELTHVALEDSKGFQKKQQLLLELTARLEGKERRRELLLKQLRESRHIVKIPYEIIAEILGENSISTVRSRVLIAKRQLQKSTVQKKLQPGQRKS
jgi:hypothetical protein